MIVYGEDARPPTQNTNWLLTEGTNGGHKRKPILQVSNIYGIFRAVQSGLGIGALPDYMSQEASNLVEILPECRDLLLLLFCISRRVEKFEAYSGL